MARMTTNTPSSEVEGILRQHGDSIESMLTLNPDEYAGLRSSFNQMQGELTSIIKTLTTNHDERMRAFIQDIKDCATPDIGGDSVYVSQIEAIAAKYITSNDEK